MIGVRQVTQIFQVKMFVSRYQLFVPDSESVYQEVQKIIGHGAVIDETAYGTYLALFDFFLYLFHQVDTVDRVVYHNIGISRYLDTITAIYFVSGENDVYVRFDNIFDKHQIILSAMLG